MSEENKINTHCPACGQAQDLENMSDEMKLKLYQMAQISGVMTQVFEFLELVSKNRSPFMTKLCAVNRQTNEQVDGLPEISLWAGIGDQTPIGRLEVKNAEIAQLKAEIERLKEV